MHNRNTVLIVPLIQWIVLTVCFLIANLIEDLFQSLCFGFCFLLFICSFVFAFSFWFSYFVFSFLFLGFSFLCLCFLFLFFLLFTATVVSPPFDTSSGGQPWKDIYIYFKKCIRRLYTSKYMFRSPEHPIQPTAATTKIRLSNFIISLIYYDYTTIILLFYYY